MFRRRALRRVMGTAAPIGEAGRLQLIRANQLNEAGEYTQAAEIFEKVAQRMENRLRPNRAAFLFLQAGHAHLEAKEIEAAMELTRRALALLAQYQHWRPYIQGGNMMIQELNRHGYTKQAEEIQALVDQNRPAQAEQAVASRISQGLASSARHLPGKCPSCGAPMRSDMAEWIDDSSAECPYCGSVITAD